MIREKGFSLTEILTTVVILAVLAGIAIPGFSKAKNKSSANQAIAYLRTIRVGEKMYYAKNAEYIACADKAALKTNLGVEVTTENYTFVVTTTGTPPSAFTATATAVSGGKTLTLNQDGTWGGTYTPLPAS